MPDTGIVRDPGHDRPRMVRTIALRRDRPSPYRPRGRRPAGHDPARLHRGADGRRRVLCPTARAVRQGGQITTFGPYSPGQAVAMKRMGIEAIYLGGWATSARGIPFGRPGSRPRELPAQPGSRRGGWPGSRAPHRRQEPAFRAHAAWTRTRADRHRRSTSARSSSPTPTRAMAETRTFGTSFVDSSRSGFRATTSRTRSRAPRSAATRAARSWSARTNRTSGSTRRACSSTSCESRHHRREDRRRVRDVP